MEFQTMNFNQVRVLIVGDVMLDQYWHGGTSRISPEAPVPVVQIQRVDERPGGAANVALNVKALGAQPHLLGIAGIDEASDTLKRLLSEQGVAHHLICVSDHYTITKLRIMSRHQQMIRLDKEKSFAEAGISALKDHYGSLLDQIDVVILSDYGKGTLSHSAEFIAKAKAKNIPVIVDPKSRDFSLYRGATLVTPNLKEFEDVVGPCPTQESLVEKAVQLMKQHDIEALVITRSEQGVSVITRDRKVTHIPALAREVHDVTGAGDTVVAMLGVAYAMGMDIVKAATLGNIAAGIVVGKLGTATVSVSEIQASLNQEETLPLGVMEEEALLTAIRISKAKGERIVFTNGCFDILHSGHVLYLEQAKRLGDRVVVAVNTDFSVSRLKGNNRPINSLEHRMNVLAGLRSVDWVIAFNEDTPERIIQAISPHVLVKGGDYQDIEALPGAKFVLAQGGKVQLLGLEEGCSTTRMIDRILTPIT